MNTLKYILEKFNLKMGEDALIEIPNVGRNDLAYWLHELEFNTGVEVGVAGGEYSETICKANPQMKIYGVDLWKGYEGYKHHIDKETFNGLYEEAKNRLSKYPNYEIIKELSMDALKRFANESLDFVYIDANHEDPYITQDIVEWYKKIRPGGIIAGHDYIRNSIAGKDEHDAKEDWNVKDAVNKFVTDNNIMPWFLLGLNAKKPGMIRDKSRSWMWIKT